MKKILSLVLLAWAFQTTNAQNFNISFLSNIPYPTGDLANIGGYVDSLGNEYALVGWEMGLSIVDVTNPTVPIVKFQVNGPQSIWREVKTFQHYAYVTTEGGGGLQIIDLGNLPASVSSSIWTGDAAISGQLDNIHSLHIEDGYVYLHGSNLFGGAAVIADLNANPMSPHYLGHTPGTYIHDGYVRGNMYYSAHVYDGYFSIFDVTNKANPVFLNNQTTPNNFTHNTWTSSNGQYLFTTDEVSNSFVASYDVSDPMNIIYLDKIQITPGSGSIVHNTHVVNKNGGDFAVTSWYKDGVVITDVTRPNNMVNVGWYDTYTQGTGNGFSGCWGVYPFLPSGNLVCSDINNGLYVLAPTYNRACYLEGIVTDSVSGLPINGATSLIITPNISKNTDVVGQYRSGYYLPGTYDVQFSKTGYFTKTIIGVQLTSGVIDTLNVQLVPVNQSIALSGTVVETTTGNPIANAQVLMSNASFSYTTNTNASGSFIIPNLFVGTYNITVGKWLYKTKCTTATFTTSSGPYSITLDNGIYDDFSFDFGWTAVSAGGNNWERAVPVLTTDGPFSCNPGADVTTDCLDQAYVTDNGGGGAFDHDIDPVDGIVTLTSPVFDLTAYQNPQINYYHWFVDRNNQNGAPNDTMHVLLTNGITTVNLETLLNNSVGNGTWVSKSWNVNTLITSTANMQLILKISDASPGNVVEGGLDKFEIDDVTGIAENNSDLSISAQPNPFSSETIISFAPAKEEATLTVSDMIGKTVASYSISKGTEQVRLGKELSKGVYLVSYNQNNKIKCTLKLIKTE